jgi:8-oxo-dGTP diphosphatase
MKQVVAALIVRSNRILICQRTRHQSMPLKWEFPGGKIEPDERPRAALFRELEEELGIRAQIGAKVAGIRHYYGPKAAVELHFYAVYCYEGRIQNRIFRDVRWVTPAQLCDYDFLEADVSLIKDLAAGKIRLQVDSRKRKSRSARSKPRP